MKNSDDEQQQSPNAVSAAYRAIATERAPAHLDQEVLRRADSERTSAPGSNWLTTRIRPLAFVVTAGLSLALLIQLSNTPVMESPAPGAEPFPENPFQDAARHTAEQIGELDTATSNPMTAPGVEMSPVQATEQPADRSLLPIEDRCADSDRAESGTWWECIRDLEKRGLSESAELELQALLKAHPQFSVPE